MMKPVAPPPDPAAWVRSKCVDMNERLPVRKRQPPLGITAREMMARRLSRRGAARNRWLHPLPRHGQGADGMRAPAVQAGRHHFARTPPRAALRLRSGEPCIADTAALGASPAQSGPLGTKRSLVRSEEPRERNEWVRQC